VGTLKKKRNDVKTKIAVNEYVKKKRKKEEGGGQQGTSKRSLDREPKGVRRNKQKSETGRKRRIDGAVEIRG